MIVKSMYISSQSHLFTGFLKEEDLKWNYPKKQYIIFWGGLEFKAIFGLIPI